MGVFIVFVLFTTLILLIKKLLCIDDLDTMKRIFTGLTSGRESFLSTIFQVDEKSTRHGGELVASVLKSHNVKEIFTLCGGHISPILTASEALGIKIIDTRHEVNAVFAADSASRLRQSIGVAAVTSGPGVTNSITALKNAQMAESPLLLLGGAAPTLLKGRGALQDIDQMILVRPLCKYVARINRLRDIVPTLRQAIQAAQSGTPGPVFVEFPIDVLYPYQMVKSEVPKFKNPTFLKKCMQTYLQAYVARQFGGAWLPQDLSPLRLDIPQPKSEHVQQSVELIQNAKKPLLLLGSQATISSESLNADDIASVVKELGIPAYFGGMARGLLGKESPIQMRQNRKDAMRDADLIILAGSVCDFRLGYGKSLSSNAKIISINRSSTQLFKNHKVFWNGDVFIQADVGCTLQEILGGLKKDEWKGVDVEWINALRKSNNEKESANASKMTEKAPDGFLNPLTILKSLDKVIPDNTILIGDGGDFVGSAAYIVRPRGPLKWLDPGAFGTLGVGGGFALGAKAVNPDAPVVIIFGDGACGFSIMEFDSFVRHKMPVIAIVGNDACWTQIAREQMPWFNSLIGCELDYTKYEKIGEGMGARGVVIGKEDSSAKFEEAMRDALEASKHGQSTVINVHIGKTDFRSGSISV